MSAVNKSLERLVGIARAILVWEMAWRALSAIAAVIALFLALAWFGVWDVSPPPVRLAGVAMLVGLAGYVALREIRSARIGRLEALKRIDRDAGQRHALATTLDDRPVNAADPAALALWRVYRARLNAKLADVRLAAPAPRAIDRDRFALRAGAVLFAAAAAIYAGPDRWARVDRAFQWTAASADVGAARLDAWIDPPPYTGKPPIVLDASMSRTASDHVSAPYGSMLIVRSSSQSAPDIATTGGLEPAGDGKSGSQRGSERKFVLKGDARITLGRQTFVIDNVPDRAPTVELTEQPRANLRGSLTLSYATDDDYGVSVLEAHISDPEIEGRRAEGPPLFDPPQLSLALPPAPNGLGEGRSTVDFADSPWAGARVTLKLVAQDEAGNKGASAPISIYLPQRPFSKPLARALVEQRRNLVLEPRRRERVRQALAALMLAPEKFGVGAGVYLGLRVATTGLAHPRSVEALRDVANLLWRMALQIEDDGATDAERELRAAEKELRDALQRNAPDQDISRLSQALREAMDKFLAEMAKRQPSSREQADGAPPSRSISRDALQKMIDQMQALAQSGDTRTAQQMLDDLQNMLENLRTARGKGSQTQAQRDRNRAMRDLDRLMQDQQKLRDDTYRDGRAEQGDEDRQQSQERRRTGEPRNSSRENRRGSEDLKQRQAELEERLADLQRRLGKRGEEQLGAAREAMRQAEGALGERGDRGAAVDAQGRALEALRQGADQLARGMKGQGDASDEAGVGPSGQQDPAEAADGEGQDPLGRSSPRSRRYDPNARYDPLGSSPALRAQRVLEELRRRLGDVGRPPDELDYLERLIRRN